MNLPSYVDWNDVNEARHFAKHGVPFRIAARIFADDKRIEAPDLRQTHDPPRFNVVGVVDGRTINVTYAMDGDIAVIISARPASKKGRFMPRISMAELLANPRQFTEEEKARLDAMTDEEIERNALEDAECPPMSDDQLDRAVFARYVRLTREASGLTQEAFAKRYAISLARLKDWEQGRFKPDSVAVAYMKVIRHDPELVQHVLETQD